MLSIFHNYRLNRFILCEDKDPPCIDKKIKYLIHRKKSLYQKQRKSGSIDWLLLKYSYARYIKCYKLFQIKMPWHLANKHNDSKTAPKTYWAILKTIVNGNKMPLIPALLADNKLVTHFLVKANLFNYFFTKQCAPLFNNTVVPVNLNFETWERHFYF